MRRLYHYATGAWIPLLLFLLAPFLLFPNPIRSIALFGLPMIWILQKWQKGYAMPATMLDGAILIILMMTLVSLYATFSVTFSLSKICGLLFHIVIFYAVVETVKSEHGFVHTLSLYFMLGLLVAMLGIISTKWLFKVPIIKDITEQLPLIIQGLPGAETGVSPNQLAGTLLWFFPLLMSLLYFNAHEKVQELYPNHAFLKWTRPCLIMTLGIIGFTFMLTQSRGGWVGGIVAIAFLSAVINKKIRWAVVASIMIFIGVASWIGWTNMGNLLVSDSTESVVGNLSSLGFRQEVWKVASWGIADFPFTGMGLGTFRKVAPVLYPLNVSPDYDIAHAHNQFLQTALDLGIFGLVAYIIIWIRSAYMLAWSWQKSHDPFLKSIILGTASSLLGYLVFAMTDTIALGAKSGVFLWWLFALSVGVMHGIKKSRETANMRL